MFEMTKFVWNRTIQVNLSCNPWSEKTFCEWKTALENNINEQTNTALKLTKNINFYWIFLLFFFLKLTGGKFSYGKRRKQKEIFIYEGTR